MPINFSARPDKSIPAADLLDSFKTFLKSIGDPQSRLQNIVHVAGTNGKGSTVHYLKQILEHNGHTVNTFTSPHLNKVNERITLSGTQISDAQIEASAQASGFQDLHFFQQVTAVALQAFRDHPSDFTLIEVGLGGEFDATNVFTQPKLNLITELGYDHQDQLGHTLTQITQAKCGILNPLDTTLSLVQAPEAMAVLSTHPIKTFVSGKSAADKARNLAIAAATECISDLEIPTTLNQPLGRLHRTQVAGCDILLDVCHNAAAAAELATYLRGIEKTTPITLYCALQKSKDVEAFMEPLKDFTPKLIQLNPEFHKGLNHVPAPTLGHITVYCGSFHLVGRFLA